MSPCARLLPCRHRARRNVQGIGTWHFENVPLPVMHRAQAHSRVFRAYLGRGEDICPSMAFCQNRNPSAFVIVRPTRVIRGPWMILARLSSSARLDASPGNGEDAVSAGFTIRSHRRFPVKCAVDYRSDDCTGKGIVRNLSRSGWRVEGHHGVAPGTILALAVWLPGDNFPIKVEKAIVRWVKGHTFGIRIIAIRPADGGAAQAIRSASSAFTPRLRVDPPSPEW